MAASRIHALESIDVGMGIEEAIRIVGHNPDFVCVHNGSVMYYFCPKWSIKYLLLLKSYSKPEASVFRNVIVQSKEDIPDIYGAFQLLSDGDGKIRAIAWNGEGLFVRTEKGEIGGGNCNSLPDEFFMNPGMGLTDNDNQHGELEPTP